MTDIKKINIYMGVVGQAYVDKETASKNLEAAQKNVLDVKHIIYLINHDYEQDIILANNPQIYPLTALPYVGNNNAIIETTRTNAVDALNLAEHVRTDLDQKLSIVDQSSPVYTALMNLKNELEKNDVDGNYENGGNVTSANLNIAKIDALISELNDILSIAQNLLEENTNYVNECEQIYNSAKSVFEAYVPEAIDDQSNKSDKLEAELINRLNNVATGIEIAQATTDAINQTSNEVQNAVNEITGGGDEPVNPEPVDPQPADNGDYYFGVATEDQVQNQSYINGLGYNIAGEKPATINFEEGFNVLVVPESWGTPILKDPNGFTYSAFGLDELGITNPVGKIVLVYSSGPTAVTLEWN